MMLVPRGIIPAMVTPLDEHGAVMEKGLRDLLDYVIDHGVHGVFILGTSGEIYGLTPEQKRQVVEVSVDHVAGRVPIYAGASEITTRDCLKTAHMAQEVGGVAALSVLTPYFLQPTQEEMIIHYRTIAQESDLPILLYTNPGKTGVSLSVGTVATLAEVDGIIGVKDSSGNLSLTADYIRETPDDFSVLMGKDTLIYPGLALGAAGAIASTANIAPALVSHIFEEFIAGNYEEAKRLQNLLAPLRNAIDTATFPVALKEGLSIAGINAGKCLLPAQPMSHDKRSLLAHAVKDAIAMS